MQISDGCQRRSCGTEGVGRRRSKDYSSDSSRTKSRVRRSLKQAPGTRTEKVREKEKTTSARKPKLRCAEPLKRCRLGYETTPRSTRVNGRPKQRLLERHCRSPTRGAGTPEDHENISKNIGLCPMIRSDAAVRGPPMLASRHLRCGLFSLERRIQAPNDSGERE